MPDDSGSIDRYGNGFIDDWVADDWEGHYSSAEPEEYTEPDYESGSDWGDDPDYDSYE